MVSLTQIPYVIAALVPALTFHEWGHAMAAEKLGDSTPRQQGRLTLNPLAHLDVLGTLAILIIGFGWARPVPINPERLKGSWGAFWVASAGPGMNFVLAIVFAVLLRTQAYLWFGPENVQIFHRLFGVSIILNLALAFFNLIPMGPLDGSHLLERLLPLRTSIRYSQWNAQYGGTILFGIILIDAFLPFGIIRSLILVPTQVVAYFLTGGSL